MAQTVYILLAAVAAATLDSLYRVAYRRGISASTLSIGLLTMGGLAVFCFTGIPDTSKISSFHWVLLFTAGALWAGMTVCDLAAFRDIPASLNALLNTGGFIATNIIAFTLFQEAASTLQVIGLGIIVLSMISGLQFSNILATRGIWFRAASVVLQVCAFSIDKFLTQVIPVDLVLISGYVTPAVLLCLVSLRKLPKVVSDVRSNPTLCLTGAALYAGIGIGLIYSLSLGDLWYTSAIYQLRTFLSWAIAYVFIGEREHGTRRALSGLAVALGAALVAIGGMDT